MAQEVLSSAYTIRTFENAKYPALSQSFTASDGVLACTDGIAIKTYTALSQNTTNSLIEHHGLRHCLNSKPVEIISYVCWNDSTTDKRFLLAISEKAAYCYLYLDGCCRNEQDAAEFRDVQMLPTAAWYPSLDCILGLVSQSGVHICCCVENEASSCDLPTAAPASSLSCTLAHHNVQNFANASAGGMPTNLSSSSFKAVRGNVLTTVPGLPALFFSPQAGTKLAWSHQRPLSGINPESRGSARDSGMCSILVVAAKSDVRVCCWHHSPSKDASSWEPSCLAVHLLLLGVPGTFQALAAGPQAHAIATLDAALSLTANTQGSDTETMTWNAENGNENGDEAGDVLLDLRGRWSSELDHEPAGASKLCLLREQAPPLSHTGKVCLFSFLSSPQSPQEPSSSKEASQGYGENLAGAIGGRSINANSHEPDNGPLSTSYSKETVTKYGDPLAAAKGQKTMKIACIMCAVKLTRPDLLSVGDSQVLVASTIGPPLVQILQILTINSKPNETCTPSLAPLKIVALTPSGLDWPSCRLRGLSAFGNLSNSSSLIPGKVSVYKAAGAAIVSNACTLDVIAMLGTVDTSSRGISSLSKSGLRSTNLSPVQLEFYQVQVPAGGSTQQKKPQAGQGPTLVFGYGGHQGNAEVEQPLGYAAAEEKLCSSQPYATQPVAHDFYQVHGSMPASTRHEEPRNVSHLEPPVGSASIEYRLDSTQPATRQPTTTECTPMTHCSESINKQPMVQTPSETDSSTAVLAALSTLTASLSALQVHLDNRMDNLERRLENQASRLDGLESRLSKEGVHK